MKYRTTKFSFLAAAAMTLGLSGIASAAPASPASITVRDHRTPKRAQHVVPAATQRSRFLNRYWSRLAGIARVGWQVGPAVSHPVQATKPGIRGKRRAARIARFDLNGDGVLSKAEKKQMRKSRFAALDINNDGVLIRSEFAKGMKKNRKLRKRRGNRGARAGNKNRARKIGKRFARIDKNGNGQVTLGEFMKAKRGQRGVKRGNKRGKRRGHERGKRRGKRGKRQMSL